MDASALSAVTSTTAAAQAQESAGVDVLRKALDAEQTIALKLIEAVSIPGLGENLDVKA